MIKQSRRLPHYCMWCMFGEVENDDVYCSFEHKTTKDPNFYMLDGGISAAAEDICCKHFDFDYTRPGADWAKALMDAEDELEIIKTMVVR